MRTPVVFGVIISKKRVKIKEFPDKRKQGMETLLGKV